MVVFLLSPIRPSSYVSAQESAKSESIDKDNESGRLSGIIQCIET